MPSPPVLSTNGRLTLTEEHDRELRRGVRGSRLRNLVDGADVLPLLGDAVEH